MVLRGGIVVVPFLPLVPINHRYIITTVTTRSVPIPIPRTRGPRTPPVARRDAVHVASTRVEVIIAFQPRPRTRPRIRFLQGRLLSDGGKVRSRRGERLPLLDRRLGRHSDSRLRRPGRFWVSSWMRIYRDNAEEEIGGSRPWKGGPSSGQPRVLLEGNGIAGRDEV